MPVCVPGVILGKFPSNKLREYNLDDMDDYHQVRILLRINNISWLREGGSRRNLSPMTALSLRTSGFSEQPSSFASGLSRVCHIA